MGVRLDGNKCLCEYGIEEGSTFEHDIEKVAVSKQAQSQLPNIKRTSKLKSLIGTRPSRRSTSSAASRRSNGSSVRCQSSTPACSSNASESTTDGSSRGSAFTLSSDSFY